jgi:hypothetical protein
LVIGWAVARAFWVMSNTIAHDNALLSLPMGRQFWVVI